MKTLVVLADGFEEIEAVVPIDLLKRAGVEVTIAGLGKKEISGSHSVKIIADKIFDGNNNDFDAIILPGGPGHLILMNDIGVLETVKEFYESQKLCCAICAAPKIFDKAGILSNKNYTCFPSLQNEIKSGNYVGGAVVQDANIITSKAAGTAVDFVFAVIKNLTDEKTAQTVADNICY
jgi:4-methyl-5(b-hydroxyethyl)-thiazole monophosphate biosynthesis